MLRFQPEEHGRDVRAQSLRNPRNGTDFRDSHVAACCRRKHGSLSTGARWPGSSTRHASSCHAAAADYETKGPRCVQRGLDSFQTPREVSCVEWWMLARPICVAHGRMFGFGYFSLLEADDSPQLQYDKLVIGTKRLRRQGYEP